MIRPYKEEDKVQVAALLRLNIPTFFAPEEEQDFMDYLEQEREEYFVLEEDGKILGCGGINFLEDKTIARISWDFFHPESQGKGLGRQLTEYRIERIKKEPGVKTIQVRTSQFAYKFYARFGFQTRKVVKGFWGRGMDLYDMKMEL